MVSILMLYSLAFDLIIYKFNINNLFNSFQTVINIFKRRNKLIEKDLMGKFKINLPVFLPFLRLKYKLKFDLK